jgi:Secretion system C-terminal sorting domain
MLFFFFIICSLLISTTHHIKQDGTGNFTTIQEGIVAATNNDTVLVYPSIYFENIDYLEKSIIVASLYIITPEDSLINQTIIDGNQVSRCVTIDDCDDFSLIGFTLQNGKVTGGSYFGAGGGVLIKDTLDGTLANCIIINNIAVYGGGVCTLSSDVLLKSNTISYNRGIQQGGGLDLEGLNNVIFDPFELNNIYLNYSCTGSDIKLYSPGLNYEIVLDTFTVAIPDEFFIASLRTDFTISIQNNKIEEIDQDLYIAPDGDDCNNGLTIEEPLQTIAWAQTLIKRNDDNPHHIFLAPGTYSPSLNNQIFPIGIKHRTKYIGGTPENTILDAEHQSSIYNFGHYFEIGLPKLYLENLKLVNASFTEDSYGAIKTLKTNLELNNVIIEDCYGDIGSAILCRDGIYNFQNLVLANNLGGKAVRISCLTASSNTNPILQIEMENVLVSNNFPGQGTGAGSGGGVHIRGHNEIIDDYYLSMINCDFNSNHNNSYDSSTGLGGASSLYLSNFLTADIVNCTFADNTLSYDTGSSITTVGANVNIYNSILFGNEGYSFIYLNSEDEVNVSHSLIEGGENNVYYYSGGFFNWHEGNLDEDPQWIGTGDYPYYLQSESPCIDAGTLDLPAGIVLPEFDLAGNPRIFGDTIDMGAYEWQGVEAEEDDIVKINETRISNYPNPFNPNTTIKLELAEAGKSELAIYNIKGQKVKFLIDAYTGKGTFEINWNGKDDIGKPVSSGQYVVKLKQNGKETATKIMLLK